MALMGTMISVGKISRRDQNMFYRLLLSDMNKVVNLFRLLTNGHGFNELLAS